MKISLNKSVCFLLSSIVLTFILAVSAQAQIEKEIVKIRASVAAINKGASQYTKTTKSVEDISLEGAEATYYRSAKNLKKITLEMYGETYNATGEFFYRDEELIFVYLKRNQYDTQIGLDKPPKVIRIEEHRYYFVNGDLIRLQVGKKELKSSDEKFSQLKEEIFSISSKLKYSY